MYEQYFREFVDCLFPNDLLDKSILDFIEGIGAIEEAREYEKKHNVSIVSDWNRSQIVVSLSRMLSEMRKDKADQPRKDLIDYNLEKIIDILKSSSANAPKVNKCISFHEFLRNQKAS